MSATTHDGLLRACQASMPIEAHGDGMGALAVSAELTGAGAGAEHDAPG